MRWQDCEDEKEKYNLYLCSREWSEKREAVRKRAHGRCERCLLSPMDACHHLTYARKYAERIDDLQAICNGCHDFTHGKSDHDPVWENYLETCRDACVEPLSRDALLVCQTPLQGLLDHIEEHEAALHNSGEMEMAKNCKSVRIQLLKHFEKLSIAEYVVQSVYGTEG